MMGRQKRRRALATRIEEPLWLREGFLRRIVHLCTSHWCVLNLRSKYWITLPSKWRLEFCWNRNFDILQVASVWHIWLDFYTFSTLSSSSFLTVTFFLWTDPHKFPHHVPCGWRATQPFRFPWTWHSHVRHGKRFMHPPSIAYVFLYDYFVFANSTFVTLGWNGEFWLGPRTVRDQISFLAICLNCWF